MTRKEPSEESKDLAKNMVEMIEAHAKYIRENHQTMFDKEKELDRGWRERDHFQSEDRDDVWRRMQLAVAKGWSSLGAWTYDWDPTPHDLFGVSPETGYCERVPFFEGETP